MIKLFSNLFGKKDDAENYDEDERRLQEEQKKLKQRRPPRPPQPSPENLLKSLNGRAIARINRSNSLQENTNGFIPCSPENREHLREIHDLHNKANESCTNGLINTKTEVGGDRTDLLTMKKLEGDPIAPAKPPRMNRDRKIHKSLPLLEIIESSDSKTKFIMVGSKAAHHFEGSSHVRSGASCGTSRKRSVSNSDVDTKASSSTHNSLTSFDLAKGLEKKPILSDSKVQTFEVQTREKNEAENSIALDVIENIQPCSSGETKIEQKSENKLKDIQNSVEEKPPCSSGETKIRQKIENNVEDNITTLPKSILGDTHNKNTILSKDSIDEKVSDLPKKGENINKTITEISVNNDDNNEDIEESEIEKEQFEKLVVIENALDKVDLRSEVCYFEDDYYILCDQLLEMSIRVDRIRVTRKTLIAKKKALLRRIQRLEKVLDDKFEYLN